MSECEQDDRIAELERRVAELTARLVELERVVLDGAQSMRAFASRRG